MLWPTLADGKDAVPAIEASAKTCLICAVVPWCITCMSSLACLRGLRRRRPNYLTDALDGTIFLNRVSRDVLLRRENGDFLLSGVLRDVRVEWREALSTEKPGSCSTSLRKIRKGNGCSICTLAPSSKGLLKPSLR